jgi:hypothetical protein
VRRLDAVIIRAGLKARVAKSHTVVRAECFEPGGASSRAVKGGVEPPNSTGDPVEPNHAI